MGARYDPAYKSLPRNPAIAFRYGLFGSVSLRIDLFVSGVDPIAS
jgi:hypothetical protein